MDNAIDLHVHSKHSDGTCSVKELVSYAKEIKDGNCKISLGDEEQKALNIAMRND